MKQNRIIAILFGVCLVAVFSCKPDRYYRTETGLLYKIYPGPGKESVISIGQTAKVNYIQRVGDSIIETTYGKMPLYYMIMPGSSPYNPLEAFDYGLKKGDSVRTIQRVDSMLKKRIFQKMPPWMHKDDEWVTTLKVVDVFTSDSLLQLDKQKEAGRVFTSQLCESRKRIEAWLKNNKISYTSTPDTVFVQNLADGGEKIADSGAALKLTVALESLKGKTIRKRDTLALTTGTHFLPPAIEHALTYTGKGGRMKIYMPAVMLVGVQPQNKDVKVDDDLVVDISILQVDSAGHNSGTKPTHL